MRATLFFPGPRLLPGPILQPPESGMALSRFEVDSASCIRCGLCVSDCVSAIIRMKDVPAIAPDDLGKCILCGHCQAICPTASITLDDIQPGSLAPAGEPVAPGVIAGIVSNRRSVRQFSPNPVEPERLAEAVEIAAWAPTARNMRDMGFVAFNGREKVVRLMEACADVMEKHGLLPDVAAHIRNNEDVLFRGAPCVLAIYAPERPFAASDCASTLAAIELALPSLGLASCWAGYFTAVCGRELPAGLSVPGGGRRCLAASWSGAR